MPFIGKQPPSGFGSVTKQDLTPDGSTTGFTLNKNVASANDVEVFVGNVRQEPTDAYSVSGNTLTMTAAPSSGTNFYVLFKEATQSTTVPAAGTTVPGAFGVSGDLTVDTNAFHVNATNDHIGFGTTSPATTNGAVTKVIGAKSSQNNILSGETGGIGYSGWIIEARQTGRTGQARFSQIIMNTDGSDNGQMLFQNAASGGDVTESIRVSSSGLSFDGGSNHLDDYEEGTWTPSWSMGTTASNSFNGSYINQHGYYVKIGSQVTVWMRIQLSSKGSTTGDLFITGLPFPSAPNSASYGNTAIEGGTLTTNYWSGLSSAAYISGYVQTDRSQIRCTDTSSATASAGLTHTVLGNSTNYYGVITYFTDA